ncbi:MAG: hypothetical protein K1Y02_18595 [Candidatus Hydrogenedentes bacterium]|nr:hypothetical protein [Candidatus Hydrogenedentota bacterium]
MTNEYEPQRDKWLAYVMGELPEAERADVEAELARNPEDLVRIQQTLAAVNGWANEVNANEPSDVAAILSKARQAHNSNKENAVTPLFAAIPKWVWAAAAVALLVIALGQVRFTVTIGGATFAWGESEGTAHEQSVAVLASELEKLTTLHAATEQQLGVLRGQYDALAQNVQGTVEALAHWQQVESAVRYRDVQQLIQLAGGQPQY